MSGKTTALVSFLLSLSLFLTGCGLFSQAADKAKEFIPGNITDIIPDEIKNAMPGGNQSTPAGNTSSAIVPAPPRGVTGTVSVGPTVAAATVPVPVSGGKIAVTDAASPIVGMEITVPANAYPEQKQFKVSYAPVQSHTFGEAFNPVTPLIEVDNGGVYADEIIEVKVPIKVPAGNFAMGFYYDDKTKKLEGIPTVAIDANSITLATRHFCKFLVSIIPDTKLKPDIDSGFRPGIDDWQFTNNGSYITPDGNCAGQSQTAMWYYCTQPDGKDKTLYGRYDNNGEKPATPGFDYDDSLGYRFASVTQLDYEQENNEWSISLFWDQRQLKYDELTWKAFAYSIQLTGEPQYVGMSSATGGHAIICYRIYQGNLYVADPNYPGNTERRILYSNKTFTPYESGANREEIEKGNSIKYDRIGYSAKTAIVDWSKIAQRWGELKAGAIGNDEFPEYKLIYVDNDNKTHNLPDNFVSPEKTMWIEASMPGLGVNVGPVIYRDNSVISNGTLSARLTLSPGNNILGMHIQKTVNNELKYVDFKHINIVYGGSLVIEPASLDGELNQRYPFTAKLDTVPDKARFDWFVDGVQKQSAAHQLFLTDFTTAGSHTVSVKLFDGAGKELMTAQAAVSVREKNTFDPNLLQQRNSLLGYLANGKGTYEIWTPTGTTTEERSPQLSFPSSSSTFSSPLRITWSGTSFSGKIDSKNGADVFTASVQGSISADGQTLTDFTYTDTVRVGNTTSDHYALVKTHSYSLQNLQMIVSPDMVIATGRIAPLSAYAVKIVDEEQQYYDGALSKKISFKSAEWASNSEFRITFDIIK